MGISDKAEAYRQRLLGLIPSLVYSGGAGGGCEPVQFDLYPRDYLAYAEASLEEQSTESRVRCVGHLKRAVDCQIALFFCCLGLEDYFKGKRLNFHRRLEFIKALGLVSPRSISRLNSIRNRVEHEFVDPKDADLLLYFDLCQCFVSVLEAYAFYICCSAKIEFEISGKTAKDHTNWFGSSYDANAKQLEARFSRDDSLLFDMSSMEDFAFGLRCHFALIALGYIGDAEECRRKINQFEVSNNRVEPTANAAVSSASRSVPRVGGGSS